MTDPGSSSSSLTPFAGSSGMSFYLMDLPPVHVIIISDNSPLTLTLPSLKASHKSEVSYSSQLPLPLPPPDMGTTPLPPRPPPHTATGPRRLLLRLFRTLTDTRSRPLTPATTTIITRWRAPPRPQLPLPQQQRPRRRQPHKTRLTSSSAHGVSCCSLLSSSCLTPSSSSASYRFSMMENGFSTTYSGKRGVSSDCVLV